MENVEATPESGTASPLSQAPVTPRQRRTLRAVLIRFLEAWLTRLRTPRSAPAVAWLPPPTAWVSKAAQVENDPVTVPARGAWQLLGVMLVLVLAGTAAWLGWHRIETLEQRHEEEVSMTLAAVEQELADQRASLGTIRTQVNSLAAQVTATPSAAAVDVRRELGALKQHVEELEMTIGAYGALLGKQQQAVAAHTEQLTTHNTTLRALATTPRRAPTTTSAKARKRSAQTTPPALATDAEVAPTRYGRPVITLPANLGAWSLGVRDPEQ